LPEDDDGLEAVARDYYGTASVLPVAGSQAAIQTLPHLIAPRRVAMIRPSYAEHARAWSDAGHGIVSVAPNELDRAAADVDALLLVNPNNPTGTRFSQEQLLRWHEALTANNGWLIVDEAFMDATPEQSLTPLCSQRGLVVLCSLGKFFGLAGARVGFVFAEEKLLQRMKTRLGPWTIPTASRHIASLALSDRRWQKAARERLMSASAQLAGLLQRRGFTPAGGCGLFQWVPHPRAAHLYDRLARCGILTRYFDDPPGLRIGLPKTDADWSRLESALAEIEIGAHP
jgi:cobalamin biosynthetic protein CobC